MIAQNPTNKRILPQPRPCPTSKRSPVLTEVETVVAHMRQRQLELAQDGLMFESAEYAERAHRIAAHLIKVH